MAKSNKQQSNPFSTGGGGTNFETRVQAAFTVLMLTGRLAPCIPPFPIAKIKLQGRYAGFNTDDCIIIAEHPQTKQEAKLFAQIKHEISITKSDDTLAEVIQSMWNDFNDKSFDSKINALALITGILSEVDINHVRPILEWARHSENEKEFLSKVRTENFSSDKKREKLQAFQKHLKDANDGIDVSDRELWKFLKVFHLIGYDLDTESGITLSLLHSLIALYSNETAPLIWSRVVEFVQFDNQNAGTITLETVPEDIRNVFNTMMFSDWSSDFKRLKEHGQIILKQLKIDVGGVHIKRSDIFELLNVAETSSFVFVSGERGSGKSSLMREFSDTIDHSIPLFCLRIEDLDRAHLDNVFSWIGLKGSLSDLEAGFALMPKKYLIIESLEKLLELENTTAFTDLLHWLNHQKNWTVIATGRDYAYQQIIFNYLQSFEVNFKTLTLKGFSDRQVQSLCEQLTPLQNFANNPKLKPLLTSPFYANFAYRVMTTGTKFSSEDGEKEFRIAVWKEIIAKEKERKNGMPIKRKNTFIDIAVSRAKRMVYGVSSVNFDEETVLKLEEDYLISRNYHNDLVSPAHDILEDWALEKYIENAYEQYSNEIQYFLDKIGHEPAINRAFRLWLHQKLRYGENIEHFIYSILDNQNIQRYWQDEAIAAVLQGDNPNEFLKLLQERLFSNNGDLLKRFCFILRIACQAPNSQIASESQTKDEKTLVDTLYFKPYGKGWQSLICFCFKNKDRITKNLEPHIIAVLDNWSSVLNLNKELPIPAREVGLLALHLLNDLKDSYNDKGDRKKLLSIIIQTISVIHEEFIELLETDIFATQGQNRRPRYIKDFCKMCFEGVESAFFCKHDPDRLIKLAYLELLIEESKESSLFQNRSAIVGDKCFGLHEYRYRFYPASGAKGLFHLLLRFHARKGLDFILELLNLTVAKNIQIYLNSPRYESQDQSELSKLVPTRLDIKLNNGEIVSQYCCEHFWLAYRGYSTVPYLLQCALMALENWLIAYTENCSEPNELEELFNYILQKSNSVMPTAVLASVATGFPEKVGKSAMPLLQTPELYRMDINRIIQERGKHETDWHNSGFKREELSKIYSEERRIAALRPWRGERLETLLVRLQFSEWKDEAFSVVDTLHSIKPQDDTLRFLLHRVDSRTWKPIVDDEENNRIIFKSENLEPDLEEIQQNTLTTIQKQNRISTIWVWATKTFKREPLEKEYYSTWRDAFTEAQTLLEQLKDETENDFENSRNMALGSIVTAAAIFLRDHYS
ncbi:ATP-binding protein, partial [Spirulina sp. 06S082]|uniref:ATP-binding protein n=1 Tax=Spirulina sp. 06S082 TaxID=3110248 RepID=UPI002B1E9BA5